MSARLRLPDALGLPTTSNPQQACDGIVRRTIRLLRLWAPSAGSLLRRTPESTLALPLATTQRSEPYFRVYTRGVTSVQVCCTTTVSLQQHAAEAPPAHFAVSPPTAFRKVLSQETKSGAMWRRTTDVTFFPPSQSSGDKREGLCAANQWER